MRLAIFGAASPTGQLIAKRALKAGYQVTILLKPGLKTPQALKRAKVISGGIHDEAAVARTIESAHAVLSALDTDRPGQEAANVRALLMIVSSMQSQGIRRLVMYAAPGQSAAVLPAPGVGLFGKVLKAFGLRRPEIVSAVDVAKASGLDWTVVHSTKPSDIPAGKLKIGTLIETTNRGISHSDLAAFMLSQVTDVAYLHKTPAINSN